MVKAPVEYAARWRDLPALAWLSARRLARTFGVAPIGWGLACAAWPMLLADLVIRRRKGTVASVGRFAVAGLCPIARSLARSRARSAVIWASVFLTMLVVCLVLVIAVVVADVVVYRWTGWSLLARVGEPVTWLVLGWIALGILALSGGLSGRLNPAHRAAAISVAQAAGVPSVEAVPLAGHERHREATTQLLFAVLQHADAIGVA